MRLFFFGSLMDRDFLAVVLGRDAGDLPLVPARLHGFARRRARGETFPVLVPSPGGSVEGLVAQGFTPEDIARLSYYETPDYALHPFPVETAEGRLEAHVFLATARLEAEETPWDFAHWAATEKPLGLLLATALMAHYEAGTSLVEIERLWPAMKELALENLAAAAETTAPRRARA